MNPPQFVHLPDSDRYVNLGLVAEVRVTRLTMTIRSTVRETIVIQRGGDDDRALSAALAALTVGTAEGVTA